MAIYPKPKESAANRSPLAGPKAILLGAVLGLVVGGAGVLAFMRTPKAEPGPPPNTTPPNSVVLPHFDAQPTVSLNPRESDWMTRVLKAVAAAPAAKNPASPSTDPGAAPNAPPNSKVPNAPSPPRLPGGIVQTPTDPGSMSLAPVRPPAPPVSNDVRLVKLDIYDANPVLDAGAVAGFARSLGATVRELHDFKDSDGREADALLILLPDNKLDQLVRYVMDKQPNVLDSSWQGDSDVRQNRLFEEPQKQLDAMERKRKELLLKFLEDATPVKTVDDAIAKLKTTIARLQIEPKLDKLAAVKVTYRPRS